MQHTVLSAYAALLLADAAHVAGAADIMCASKCSDCSSLVVPVYNEYVRYLKARLQCIQRTYSLFNAAQKHGSVMQYTLARVVLGSFRTYES